MKKQRRRSGPRTMAARSKGSTVSQLRDDIDSGKTGDKIDWPDPAAAPLGTDDEAAGTPARARTVAKTRRRERAQPSQSVADRRWPHAGWLQVAVVALLVAAAIGWIVSQL